MRNAIPLIGVLMFSALLGSPVHLAAQETGTVSGRVVSADNMQPLNAVQVSSPTSRAGTLSGSDGSYRLQLPPGPHTIRANLIGYTPASAEITVAAGQVVELNFSLRGDVLGLDEIVVTGTPGGSQRRAIGNVVSTVPAAQVVEKLQINNMQELLSGRTPGLTFMRSSGDVGTGSTMQIRGISSFALGQQPLIYIDGIRMQNRSAGPPLRESGGTRSLSQPLDDLNPNEIESIEVVKGPAAATLYGTEASAGVINIITKKGVAGAPTFDLSITQGTNFLIDPSGKIGDQWSIHPETGELIQFPGGYRNIYDYHVGEFGEHLLNYGYNQGYSLSSRGGTDRVRYYTSAAWGRDEGVVDHNWAESLNLRANLTVILSESFNADVSTGIITGTTRYADTIVEGSVWGVGLRWSRPVGAWLDPDSRGFLRYGPEEWEMVEALRDHQRITSSITLNHTLGGWLTQRLVMGMDRSNEENSVLIPRHPEGAAGPYGGLGLGRLDLHNNYNLEATFDYAATAKYRLGSLGLATSFGAQYYESEFNNLRTLGYVFPAPEIRSIGGAATVSVDNTYVPNKSMGVYLQQQVDLNERIFVTAAVRGDDNSAFGKNFDAAIYPKLSATWVLSEEPFWSVPHVNTLRLRAALGQAGRQPSTFDAVTTYEPMPGPAGAPAMDTGALGNPDIGPEVGTELEVGFDYGLLNDRLAGEFTYFYHRTKDALLSAPVAPSHGFSGSIPDNLGQLDTWGWELSVNARAVDRPRWGLDFGLRADHTTNEIKDLGGRPETGSLRLGWPYRVWTSRRVVSAEFDQFGQVTNVMCDSGTADRRPGGPAVPCSELSDPSLLLGPMVPPYTFSVDAGLRLGRNLQLFTLLYGAHGHWDREGEHAGTHGTYSNTLLANSRSDPLYVAAVKTSGLTDQTQGGGLFDASFWRVREIGARYELPRALLFGGIDGGSISLSGRNLLMIWRKQTEIWGSVIADPEKGQSGTGQQGGDRDRIPPLSNVSVKLDVRF